MEGKLQKGIPHNSQSTVAENCSTLVEEVANTKRHQAQAWQDSRLWERQGSHLHPS